MSVMKKLRINPPSDVGIDRLQDATTDPPNTVDGNQAKIEIFGKEMIEQLVKDSGNSGRVYLPVGWVGNKVKIIRID